MWRKTIARLMAFVITLASLSSIAHQGRAETDGPTASNTILITEVQFDPPQAGADSPYEWFELYNVSTSSITLNNWKVMDNSTSASSVRAFTTTIAARGIVIIAAKPVSFTENFPGVLCPVVDLGANIGSSGLSNTGDRLIITDSVGSLVDALSYGSDSTVLSPSISIGSNTAGTSLERLTLPDTDTSADWQLQPTPTPCIVPFNADLVVSKTGPGVSVVNTPITYALSARNTGTVFSATNVILTDTLPAGMSFVSDSSGLTPTIAGQNIRWDVGALNAGAGITFSLVVSPAGATTYTNTLTATTADPESKLTNNTALAATLVTTPTDLALTKTGPVTYTPGSLLTYTLALSNVSAVLAENVTISDALPANASYVSDTSGLGSVVAGSTITWNVGTLSPGSTLTFTLSVSVSASWRGPVTNEARAASTTADLNPINNTSRTTATTNAMRICEIQGAAQLSPLRGQPVFGVPGIVIAKRGNGFFLQDPNPDANEATSEGIFVFTSITPTVSVGDSVMVTGTVAEFRTSNTSANLTQSEISSPVVQVLSSGNALPAPTVIGLGGRTPPTEIIDNDALSGTAEMTGTLFDPAQDGLDFYESLEGMLVQVNNAVAVGPTTANSSLDDETPVLADAGISATVRTPRGGIVIRPGDFNPERVILSGDILGNNLPDMRVGDRVTGPITGVMDYTFGNFKLNVTAPFTFTSGGLTKEVTTAAITHELSIATFNVENLSSTDPDDKFAGLAAIVVNNLKSPDIIAVEEIQDNNGAVNDTLVDASLTYTKLITTIATAGGPAYQYRQIDPVDDQDGGEPGGNIRVGFLFRADRGVSFVDRPGGTAISDTQAISVGGQLQLRFSPGRISPNSPYFVGSRKPLAGEFLFEGKKLFVIANHFRSKGGDDPLFGRWQPPVRNSEITRTQQALLVQAFVSQALTLDPKANIVVLGDINDYQFSPTMAALKGSNLNVLMDTLPENERYTYVFEGNSQAIDHMLVSQNVLQTADPIYDVVHVNAEFTPGTRASDHDPQVARLYFGSKRFKVLLPLVHRPTL